MNGNNPSYSVTDKELAKAFVEQDIENDPTLTPDPTVTRLPYSSKYLQGYQTNPSFSERTTAEQIMNHLGEEQSIGAQWGNASIKMLGLAGTTFAETFTDLIVGLPTALAEGRLAGLYDNEVSRNFDKFNDWLEESFPNYYTLERQNNPWTKNLGTANFWADKVFKNLGFTIGAIGGAIATSGIGGAAMGIKGASRTAYTLAKLGTTEAKLASMGIKQMDNISGIVTDLNKIAKATSFKNHLNMAQAGLIAASTEGGIEARQAREMYINDKINSFYEEHGVAPDNQQIEQFKIEADAVGNAVWGLNIPVLMVSNLSQFGRAFSRLPDKQIKKLNRIVDPATGKRIKDLTLPELAAAKLELPKRTPLDITKSVMRTMKNPLVEGVWEEGSQFAIEAGMRDYFQHKYDADATASSVDFIGSLVDGFRKTWGTNEGQESMIIGAIIGSLGLPSVRRIDGKRKLVPQGGVWEEIARMNEEKANTKEAIDFLNNNKHLDSFSNFYDQAVFHTAYNKDYLDAIKAGDFFLANKAKYNDFANMITSSLKNGTYDVIMDKMEDASKLPADQFAQLFGIEASENFNESEKIALTSALINKAKGIKEIWDNTTIRFSDASDKVRDVFVHSTANVENIKSLKDDLSNEIITQSMGILSQKDLETLFENKDTEAIKEINDRYSEWGDKNPTRKSKVDEAIKEFNKLAKEESNLLDLYNFMDKGIKSADKKNIQDYIDAVERDVYDEEYRRQQAVRKTKDIKAKSQDVPESTKFPSPTLQDPKELDWKHLFYEEVTQLIENLKQKGLYKGKVEKKGEIALKRSYGKTVALEAEVEDFEKEITEAQTEDEINDIIKRIKENVAELESRRESSPYPDEIDKVIKLLQDDESVTSTLTRAENLKVDILVVQPIEKLAKDVEEKGINELSKNSKIKKSLEKEEEDENTDDFDDLFGPKMGFSATTRKESEEELEKFTERRRRSFNAVARFLNTLKTEGGIDIRNHKVVLQVLVDVKKDTITETSFNNFVRWYSAFINEPINVSYRSLFTKRTEENHDLMNDAVQKNGQQLNEDLPDVLLKAEHFHDPTDDYQVITPKVKIGHNKFAYLSRAFKAVRDSLFGTISKEDIDNKIKPSITSDPTAYLEGTVVYLVPETEKTFEEYVDKETGEVVTFESLTTIEIEGKAVQNTSSYPIGIYDSLGNRLAYLHTVAWINNENVAVKTPQELLQDQKELSEIRRRVLKEGRVKTNITEKGYGRLIKLVENKLQRSSEAFPSKNLEMTIGRAGDYYVSRTKTFSEKYPNAIILNRKQKKEVARGVVHAMLRVGTEVEKIDNKKIHKPVFIAAPVRSLKLKQVPEYINAITKAIKIYQEGNSESRDWKDLVKAGYNFNNLYHLVKYIENFTAVYKVFQSTIEDDLSSDVIIPTESRILHISNKEPRIIFSRGLGVGKYEALLDLRNPNNSKFTDFRGSTITADEFFKALEKHLADSYIRIDLDRLGESKSFSMPILTEKKEGLNRKVYSSYTSYIKDHTETNLASFKLTDDQKKDDYVYTIQNVITFNTSFLYEDEVSKAKRKSNPSTETPKEKKKDIDNTSDNTEMPDVFGFNIQSTTSINELADKLYTFLNKLNFSVQYVDKIKSEFGNNAVALTDFLYKVVQIKKSDPRNRTNRLATETAYVAYKMLGRTNKIRTDLVRSIENHEKYPERYAEYKKKSPNLSDFAIKELIVIDFLADAIANNYFEPNEQGYQNRKAEYWKIDAKTELGRRIKYLLSRIKQFIENLFTDTRLSSSELDSLLDDIANDILNEKFDKFGTMLLQDQEYRTYHELMKGDPQARRIVDQITSLGIFLTGSLSLRQQGTIFRKPDESLHDLDFTVPYSLFKDDFEQLMRERDQAIEQIKKHYPISDPNRNNLIAAIETKYSSLTDGFVQSSTWFQEIKRRFPTLTKVRSFGGNIGEQFTWTGIIDGKYTIDFFITPNDKLGVRNNDIFQNWESIFRAKLKMGRAKDMQDHANFVRAVTEEQRNEELKQLGTIPGLRHFVFENLDTFFEDDIFRFNGEKTIDIKELEEKSGSYIIKQLGLERQTAFVDNVISHWFKNMTENSLTTFNEVKKFWWDTVTEWKKTAVTNNKKEAIKEFDLILKNFDALFNIVDHTVRSIKGVTYKPVPEETVDMFNEETATSNESNEWDDNWSLLADPRDSYSVRLRLYLGAIRDRIYHNGELTLKRSFYGKEVMVPMDTVINTVSMILANKMVNTWSTFKALLEENIPAFPFLRDVIDKLEDGSKQVQNEFVTQMHKHTVQMEYAAIKRWVSYSFPDEDGFRTRYANVQMIPLDTNYKDRARAIRSIWYNKFKNTPAVSSTGNGDALTYNQIYTEEVANLLEKAKGILDPNEQLAEIRRLLYAIGIVVSEETLQDIYDNGVIGTNKKRISFENLWDPASGLFGHIIKDLRTSKDKEFTIDQINPLFQNTSIINLSKLEARYIRSIEPTSFNRSDGKTVSGYANNKFLIDRLRSLQNDEKVRQNLLQIPFSSSSTWLNELNDSTSVLSRYIGYSYADTLTEFSSSSRNKPIKNMTKPELELYRLTMFMNRGMKVEGGRRIIKIPYFTMSDGSIIVNLTTVGIDVDVNSEGIVTDSTLEQLFDIVVQPEIDRINQFESYDENKTNNADYNRGASQFLIIPALNSIKADRNSSEFRIKAKKYLKAHIENKRKRKEEEWRKFGFTQTKTKKHIGLPSQGTDAFLFMDSSGNANYKNNIIPSHANKNPISFLATDYIVNSLVANMNQLQLFIGDPAYYYKNDAEGTFRNMVKRLSGHRGPGLYPAGSKLDTFKMVVLDDMIVPSAQQYLNKFGDYTSITVTDGQEFTTFAEHLKSMYYKGDLSEQAYNELLDKESKESLDHNDLKRIFANEVHLGAFKPQYWGTKYNPIYNIEEVFYIKSSSIPLIKQFTKNHELDKLRILMNDSKNGFDRATFKTALKVGTPTNTVSIFDGNKLRDNIKISQDNIIELSREGFKLQTEVPFHEEGIITDSSQKRKMLLSNLLDVDGFIFGSSSKKNGREMQKLIDDQYGKLYRYHREKLQKSIENEDGTVNKSKLEKILLEEALKRGMSLNEIEGLKISSNDNTKFKLRLTFHPMGTRLESLLNSIVDNRIRRLKVRGESLVLVTEAGFKQIYGKHYSEEQGIVYTRSYDPTKGLQSSTVKDGKVTRDQIIVTSKFKDDNGNYIDFLEKNEDGSYKWLDNDGKVDASRVPEEVLRAIGYRIPYQGLGSTANIEIVGFIPDYMGDLVIAPKEFVVRMGSDFDVDKLYLQLFNTYSIDGTIYKKYPKSENEQEREVNDIITKLKFGKHQINVMEQELAEFDFDLETIYINSQSRKLSPIDAFTAALLEEAQGEFKKKYEQNKKEYDTLIKRLIAIKQGYKKSLENELVSMQLAVLDNPSDAVQEQLHRPSPTRNNSELFEYASDIKNLQAERAKNDKEIDIPFIGITDDFQRDIYFTGKSGKDGVSIFSLYNAFNSVVQGKGIIYSLNKAGKSVRTPVKYWFGEKSTNEISDKDTEDGFTKSWGHTLYQSASVDNAKDPILGFINANNRTFPIIGFLTQKGIVKEVPYFLVQDIIKEYVEELDNNSSIFNARRSNISDAIYQKLYEKYNSIRKEKGEKEEIGEELKRKAHSIDVLRDMISRGADVENYASYQLAILDTFRDLERDARNFSSLATAFNVESKGIAKNIILAKNQQLKIWELLNKYDSPWENLHRILGEGLTKKEYNSIRSKSKREQYTNIAPGHMDPYYIKPTTLLGHAIINSLVYNNGLWVSEFEDYFAAGINGTFDKIIEITEGRELSSSLRGDIEQSLWNEFRIYTYTLFYQDVFGSELAKDRKELMFDIYDEGGELVRPSLGSQTMYLKESEIGNNAIINLLKVNIGKGVSPTTISFNNDSAKFINDLYVHQGFLDLFMNPRDIVVADGKYTINTMDYGINLIKQAFLSGNTIGFESYFKYIPFNVLEQLGIIEAINNININDKEALGLENSREHYGLSNFIVQYIQHYPNKAYIIDDIDQLEIDNKYITVAGLSQFKVGIDEKTKEYKLSVPRYIIGRDGKIVNEREVAPEFISIRDYNSPKGLKLFKLVRINDDLSAQYEHIPVLGKGPIYKEYDISQNVAPTYMDMYYSDPIPKTTVSENTPPAGKKMTEAKIKNTQTTPVDTNPGTEKRSGKQMLIRALHNISQNSRSAYYRAIAVEIQKAINNVTTPIEVVVAKLTAADGPAVLTRGDNKYLLEIDKERYDKYNSLVKDEIILHEVIHILSIEANNQASPGSKQETALRRLLGIFNEVKDRFTDEEWAEFVSTLPSNRRSQGTAFRNTFGEFISLSFTSPDFQKKLKSMKYDAKENKTMFQELWDRIVDVLAELWNIIMPKDSMLYATSAAIFDLIKTVEGGIPLEGKKETKQGFASKLMTNIKDHQSNIKNLRNEINKSDNKIEELLLEDKFDEAVELSEQHDTNIQDSMSEQESLIEASMQLTALRFGFGGDILDELDESESQIYADDVDVHTGIRAGALIAERRTELLEIERQLARNTVRRAKLQNEARLSGEPINRDLYEVLSKTRVNLMRRREEIKNKDIPRLSDITLLKELEVEANADFQRIRAILNKNDLSIEDLYIARKLINTYKHSIRLFLTEEEGASQLATGNITEGGNMVGWGHYESLANAYGRKLDKIEEEYAKKIINEEIDLEDMGIDEIFMNQKDISWVQSYVLDISRTDNPLLAAIYKRVKQSSIEAQEIIVEAYKEIDEEVQRVMPKLKRMARRGSSGYDILKQIRLGTNEFTGRIVQIFSANYQETWDELWKATRTALNKTRAYGAMRRWQKKNQIHFDPTLLFHDEKLMGDIKVEYSDEARDALIAELKEILGEQQYQVFYERAKKQIDTYKELRDTFISNLEEEDMDESEKALAQKEWEISNSPYEYSNDFNKEINYQLGTGYGWNRAYRIPYKGYRFVTTIPRRIIDNKDSEWYDPNFNTISNDSDLYRFYNFVLDKLYELNSFIPISDRGDLAWNTMPIMHRTILETLTEGGLQAAGINFLDRVKMNITGHNLNAMAYAQIDPDTKKVERRTQINLMKENRRRIERLTQAEIVDWTTRTGSAPSKEEQLEIKKKVMTQLAEESSFDINKILKAYTNVVTTYRFKSEVEDELRIVDNIIGRAEEFRRNAKGELIKNEDAQGNRLSLDWLNFKRKEKDNNYKNLKAQWNYFVDFFYGHHKKIQGVTKMNVKTSEEKKLEKELLSKKRDLENTWSYRESGGEDGVDLYASLTDIEITNTLKIIDDQLKEIGNPIVGSEVGRELLKWVHLKGMGWNLFSAFANLGFGWISNYTEAAGGRYYTVSNMNRAYRYILASMVKNATFNLGELPLAKKIRKIMEDYNVEKDITNELYKINPASNIAGRFKWMNPYAPQKRTEYINQATVMLAIMFNTKLENGVSLWDAYDKTGNWDTEKMGDKSKYNKSIIDAKFRIDDRIKLNHGNYDPDSPIMAKATWFGQAISQFRMWAYEGFRGRWAGKENNYLTKIDSRGRFGTIGKLFTDGYDNPAFTTFDNILFTLKQLGRKMVFKNTQFDDVFDEARDAENMRKNLQELYIWISLLAMMVFLKSGDDDDDKVKVRDRLVRNYLLNQLFRLGTDIAFYFDPISFEALIRNPLPVTKIITDSYDLGVASYRFAIGDDIIQGGFYAGNSRLLREAGQFFPGTQEVFKTLSATGQIYKHR